MVRAVSDPCVLCVSRYLHVRYLTGTLFTTDEVKTLVGSGGVSGYRDAPGTSALLFNPSGLAISPNGTLLYFSDRQNQRLRVVHTGTGAYTHGSHP
eukprot:9475692-Pyramimonas_sp.AAC.2